MNSKWLPWILAILITIGAGIFNYTLSRVDRTSEAQGALYKEYVTRLEYDKDYRSFCARFDSLEVLIKDQNNKLDRMINIVRRSERHE